MYVHIFDLVDSAFSYGRALIACWFLQESFKLIESSLHEIWNADAAFLLNNNITGNIKNKVEEGLL